MVSPGTHDVSEWNHLKSIVHLFPVLMQRCLFTVYWTVLPLYWVAYNSDRWDSPYVEGVSQVDYRVVYDDWVAFDQLSI